MPPTQSCRSVSLPARHSHRMTVARRPAQHSHRMRMARPRRECPSRGRQVSQSQWIAFAATANPAALGTSPAPKAYSFRLAALRISARGAVELPLDRRKIRGIEAARVYNGAIVLRHRPICTKVGDSIAASGAPAPIASRLRRDQRSRKSSGPLIASHHRCVAPGAPSSPD